jgi:hypothetical protein
MDTFWLVALVALAVGAFGLFAWRRRRWEAGLALTRHRVRCPIYGGRADVTVATDLAARSTRQHVEVRSCSLRPNVAVGLPERVAYLWDGPPCKVRMEPASAIPVYTDGVRCPQHCVDILNVTSVSAPAAAPVRCSSGAIDAISLAEQAHGGSRMARLLRYADL